MDLVTQQVEQQFTVLLRRVQKIHLSTAHGEMALERSAYGILCTLADDGPQRLGALADNFGLDPSTITRQVQALEEAGLAQRKSDPTNRRASILDLTSEGRHILDDTRAHRRERFAALMADWSEQDRLELARLLGKFNGALREITGHA